MVLPPKRIPGLLSAKEGTFRGELPAPPMSLDLFAQNIVLAEGADENGFVYFAVDSRPRAFIYRTTFARQGDPSNPVPETRPAIRIDAPLYALAGPKFSLTIEADNGPVDAPIVLRVARYANGELVTDLMRRFPTPQQMHMGFSPQSKDGALLFEASVTDWKVDLDTTGIVGSRRLEVALLGDQSQSLATANATVVFDDSPPENVRFVNPPAVASNMVALPLVVTGNDPESGIGSVDFFLGKPVDGALPKDAKTTAAEPTDPARQNWKVQLPVTGAAGPTDITAQVTNRVGLSTYASISVQLSDKVPVPPTQIVGRVFEGELPQAGLEVVLADEKGKQQAKVKTGADGRYAFTDVKPGKYKVSTAKPTSSTTRRASEDVDLKPGQTATVNLTVTL